VTEDISSAVLSSWSIPFWPTVFTLLLSFVYVRGWRRASLTRPLELPLWRLISFHAGLAILWLSISSPLDALGEFLLVAHMTQHLLLMSVVPPLILLGAPVVPLLRGLPRVWMREIVATWIDFPPFQALGRLIAHPMMGWLAMNAAYAVWHIPVLYELALRSNEWHYMEHACFLVGSLGYWWHVIQPWPSRSRWSRWLVLPYIVAADIVNTAISASLAFGSRVFYPTYASVPRIFDLSPLADQMAAGAEMWVLGSLISLIPLMAAVLDLLAFTKRRMYEAPEPQPLPRKRTIEPFDWLKVPLLGRLLRARNGRLMLQVASFVLMLAVLVHGFKGTDVSALNLAGGFVWMLLRPLLFLLILGLLNVFCMACPFTLPRELARMFYTPKRQWPRILRNKWIAVALTLLFFWIYLECDLWNWPSATAWLLIGYTASALLVDTFFAGASFCKYVCPLGQFNFLTSLAAPFSLGVREHATCTSCAGKDCVRGNTQQRGCELKLYLPQKIGNMDCTLCMDCVKACPHDNLQLVTISPLRELVDDPARSSVRRFSQRADLALLALLFTLFSLWNAAAMTAPVLTAATHLRQQFPLLGRQPITLLLFLALVVLAVGFVWIFSRVLQLLTPRTTLKTLFSRLAVGLLPFGLATWIAHLLFHLTTSAANLLPAIDQFSSDMGAGRLFHWLTAATTATPALCAPGMVMLASGGGGTNLMSLQFWILDAGALGALYLLWWSLRPLADAPGRRVALWLCASCVVALSYGMALWIFTQPMLMPGAGGQ